MRYAQPPLTVIPETRRYPWSLLVLMVHLEWQKGKCKYRSHKGFCQHKFSVAQFNCFYSRLLKFQWEVWSSRFVNAKLPSGIVQVDSQKTALATWNHQALPKVTNGDGTRHHFRLNSTQLPCTEITERCCFRWGGPSHTHTSDWWFFLPSMNHPIFAANDWILPCIVEVKRPATNVDKNWTVALDRITEWHCRTKAFWSLTSILFTFQRYTDPPCVRVIRCLSFTHRVSKTNSEWSKVVNCSNLLTSSSNSCIWTLPPWNWLPLSEWSQFRSIIELMRLTLCPWESDFLEIRGWAYKFYEMLRGRHGVKWYVCNRQIGLPMQWHVTYHAKSTLWPYHIPEIVTSDDKRRF